MERGPTCTSNAFYNLPRQSDIALGIIEYYLHEPVPQQVTSSPQQLGDCQPSQDSATALLDRPSWHIDFGSIDEKLESALVLPSVRTTLRQSINANKLNAAKRNTRRPSAPDSSNNDNDDDTLPSDLIDYLVPHCDEFTEKGPRHSIGGRPHAAILRATVLADHPFDLPLERNCKSLDEDRETCFPARKDSAMSFYRNSAGQRVDIPVSSDSPAGRSPANSISKANACYFQIQRQSALLIGDVALPLAAAQQQAPAVTQGSSFHRATPSDASEASTYPDCFFEDDDDDDDDGEHREPLLKRLQLKFKRSADSLRSRRGGGRSPKGSSPWKALFGRA